MEKDKKKKICLAASSGGHFEQILMLKPLLDKYEGFILTEKTAYQTQVDKVKMHYVMQVNRKEWNFWLKLILISVKSLGIYIKERPKVIITTGVLAMIPICLIVKFFGGKLIYIESFAKVNTPTKTGQFMYKRADKFYVQWESLKEFYPDAECLGGIY